MKVFFVYRDNGDGLTLYADGLTARESYQKYSELDKTTGYDGTARVGRLDDYTLASVCDRLGIYMDFLTIQQIAADGLLKVE